MQSAQPIWATRAGPRLQGLRPNVRHLFQDLGTNACQRPLPFPARLWLLSLLSFLHGERSPCRSLVQWLRGSHSRPSPLSLAASWLFSPQPCPALHSVVLKAPPPAHPPPPLPAQPFSTWQSLHRPHVTPRAPLVLLSSYSLLSSFPYDHTAITSLISASEDTGVAGAWS